MEVARIFIGYDEAHRVAYHTLAQSIIDQSSIPVAITAIRKQQVPAFTRNTIKDITQFKYSRFLVPYMCNYEGWAIFMDMDMLLVDDVGKLWAQKDEKYAAQVVKHRYDPRQKKNPVGGKARVNWSSMILYNCAKCTTLTPEQVSTASYAWLHNFQWLDDSQLGSIDKRWNFLVAEYEDESLENISILHYTRGGPWVKSFRDRSYVSIWDKWKSTANYTTGRWPK